MDAVALSELRKPRAFPAVSVMIPTHRHPPANRQDPARLHALLARVRRRLESDARIPARTARTVVQGLERAAGQVDLAHAHDGLVLFAAPDGEHHAFVLDQPVEERVVVDHAFATRDLVAAHTRTTRHWLLVLSDVTRLWDGRADGLTEVTGPGFPLDGAGGSDRADRLGPAAAAALATVNGRDPRPVVVAGTTRDQARFEEAARGSIVLAGRIDGDHGGADAAELAELARPALGAYEDLREVAVLSELEAARGLRRYAAGLAEVTRLAEEGRGAHLIVERGYHAAPAPPAARDAREVQDAGVAGDAVDGVIETVLAYGGEVTFVSDGFLVDHDRIALVVRY